MINLPGLVGLEALTNAAGGTIAPFGGWKVAASRLRLGRLSTRSKISSPERRNRSSNVRFSRSKESAKRSVRPTKPAARTTAIARFASSPGRGGPRQG